MYPNHLYFKELVLLLTLLCAGCAGAGTNDAPDNGSALGEAGQDDALWSGDEAFLTQEASVSGLFAAARSELWGEEKPAKGALDSMPGRRVFLCAYQDSPVRVCATGQGKTLRGSVERAARALSARAGGAVAKERREIIRLKIDVVTKTSSTIFKRPRETPKKREVATYGYFVRIEDQISWIAPSEVLETGLFSNKRRRKGIDRKKVVKALGQRNSELGELDEEFAYDKIRTIAWVERDPKGETGPGIMRLYRTHSYDFDSTAADRLLQREVWAADYLISSVTYEGKNRGKIRYEYKVVQDKNSRSYNLLRHGGTTYSILQVYDRTRFEPYRLASEAAFDYLFARCKRDVRKGPYGPDDGGESMWVLSPGKKVKLGGAGLALVAIDQYVEATKNKEKYLDEARAFGRFLVASQKESGEFIYFPALTPNGPPTSKDGSAYYPGEAILGLVRLHSWDPNPQWLDTAMRAADWLIEVRDKGKNEKQLANDHWLMLALSYLYHYSGKELYLTHSLNLARAVEYQYLKNKKSWKKYPDFRGGYYDPPRSTPAATRGEGLGAVLDTCKVAKIECDWVEELLHETVRHEMLSQYDPDTSYWIKDRAKAFGGWNGGLLDPNVRNDFVQHNMSSLLGLERFLRARDGETIPGGPGWTERYLGGEEFTGIPAEEMAKLRSETLRYRGKTKWEEEADKAAALP
jgi:hypothetical protein